MLKSDLDFNCYHFHCLHPLRSNPGSATVDMPSNANPCWNMMPLPSKFDASTCARDHCVIYLYVKYDQNTNTKICCHNRLRDRNWTTYM